LKTFENLYKEKQYSQALEYLKNHQSEFPLSIYHHNLSAVFFQLKEFPLSRYHLIKAESYGLTDGLVFQNKSLINRELDLERLERPINISDYVYKFSMNFENGGFATLSLGIILIGTLVLFRLRNLKSGLIVSLLAIVPLIFQLWTSSLDRYISKNEVKLFDGPSGIFETDKLLPMGVLLIVKEHEDWLEVVYPSRFEGWVNHKNLIKVK
jgi:hypothetical protein